MSKPCYIIIGNVTFITATPTTANPTTSATSTIAEEITTIIESATTMTAITTATPKISTTSAEKASTITESTTLTTMADCKCNLEGSNSPQCDINGRCSCKQHIKGKKCGKCKNFTRGQFPNCTSN